MYAKAAIGHELLLCHDAETQARSIAEGLGQWKGLAAYYLVVASMLEVNV